MVVSVSCKKLYNPPAISAPGSCLVVEGVINNGPDSTIFKLSHTVNLASKITLNLVTGAVLTMESDQNTLYPLTETRKGNYGIGSLQLDNTRKYRLRIKTADDEYLSDFVPVINAPLVDTVNFNVESKGIQINVGTHDTVNNTKYYRWDYQETWVIHSNYYSFYKSNGDSVIDRNLMNDEVYQCWRSDTANGINVASSSHLQKDVVSNNPLTFVSAASEKLSAKYSIVAAQSAPTNSAYSILVRQYALTADAYTFWANLKKNTELLGSVFDAQPSQLQGNIHSETTPAEPVIGYISAGTVTSKRIFIKNQEVSAVWASPPAFNNCKLDTLFLSWYAPGATVPLNQENEYFNYNKGNLYSNRLIPVVAIWNQQLGTIIGHTGSTPECVDCTLRGTNKQPEYWR